jgi:hypothetical protein
VYAKSERGGRVRLSARWRGVDREVNDSADVVSVPEAAGRDALARLLAYAQPAVAPGPVALTGSGRVLFYVAPGGRDDLPELLDWLDWGGVHLDLQAFAAADVPDPPVVWLHPAAAVPPSVEDFSNASAAEPPELIALLATIATACYRLAVMRGARTGRDIQRLG